MVPVPGPNGLTKLLYTPAEAAEVLGLSRSRIYRLLADGRLESVQLGSILRIPADALGEFLESLRCPPHCEGPEAA